MNPKERAAWLLMQLPQLYPDAHCALEFQNPLELLVATILSAQCTDKRVNIVTKTLFARLKSLEDYANISQEELETLIYSTGFYRNKAKNIRTCARQLLEIHHGIIPQDLDTLASLAGVGRKTANVLLGNAFGINAGMVVDTHIGRLSRRLGLTTATNPIKIEQDLMALFPQESWMNLSHWLISHGRAICQSRKPDCLLCPLAHECPSAGKS